MASPSHFSHLPSQRNGFNEFIQGNPGTAFTDNALFWTGVCYDKLGQFDRAIGSYSDVFQRYPAEDFVAPSLYRLAETFLKMDSKSEATLTLQKLVDEHKGTVWAQRGQELLTSIAPARKGKGRR